MSDLPAPPKKIKLSIPKTQPSASTASFKTEQKDNTSQHGPRFSSIKIVKKEEMYPSSFIKQEPSNSNSTVENSKRSRKSKVKLDDDYDYEQDDMASTEAFGAEDYAFDPDELQDFDDDYDVLGKPRKTKTKKQASSTAQTTEFEMQEVDSNFRYLQLKPDHVNRPLWVTPDGRVFLETFSPIYKQAYDFMIAIAEPVCRPEFIHEYQLTPHSLYAAVSVGLETETIISVLNRLSKVQLGEEVKTFIRSSTQNYGKVKLVLKRNKFYVESPYPEVLKELMKDSVISKACLEGEEGVLVVSKALKERAAARIAEVQDIDLTAPQQNSDDEDQTVTELQSTQQQPASSSRATATTIAGSTLTTTGIRKSLFDELGEGVEEDPEKVVLAFEIKPDQVEHVKARCLPGGLNYPMLEEYDFKHDTHNADLAVELKPHVKLRPYQEKSLSKMFGNGRGRSGIIVLPCGAGKSLVGVAAATRIKKSCLCLCTSSVSVDQWRHQFLLWTSLQEHQVSRFTSESKEVFAGLAGICITTFTMVAFSGKRSEESEKVMQMIKEREWGLLLMDEVHVVPAQMFRKVISIVHSHCKLGLTATLVREDERIGDLNFLIGPKLYEANWLDLTRAGHIANVQCAEVWCPMTKEFYSEYLKKENGPRRQLLYVMNPNKFRACQFLINFHEGQRGDKVIVFSDNIWALREYATLLGKPFIYGPTGHAERTRVLHAFKHDPNVNTVFLSKVGDNSLDIPEANVLIQISSHAGSRRQEAQRLGRILRAKQGKAGSGQEGEFNAFFYTLVSRDTQEMYYSTKRQQFLIDQGYSFKVITNLLEAAEESQLAQGHFTTQKQQLDLLSRVLVAGLEEAGVEVLGDKDGDTLAAVKAGGARRRRDAGSMAALSGASGMSYLEYSRAGGGRGFGGGRWGGGRSSGPYQGEKAKALSRKLLGIK